MSTDESRGATGSDSVACHSVFPSLAKFLFAVAALLHAAVFATPSVEIVCYGDSVTKGTGADVVTMDGRDNYFGGRLAGVANVPQSYPYWLSGMLSEDYDVVNQSRGSTYACHVASWMGLQDVSVKTSFTLPASGGGTLGQNFVFAD